MATLKVAYIDGLEMASQIFQHLGKYSTPLLPFLASMPYLTTTSRTPPERLVLHSVSIFLPVQMRMTELIRSVASSVDIWFKRAIAHSKSVAVQVFVLGSFQSI